MTLENFIFIDLKNKTYGKGINSGELSTTPFVVFHTWCSALALENIRCMNEIQDSKGRFHGVVRATQIHNTLAGKSIKGGNMWVPS